MSKLNRTPTPITFEADPFKVAEEVMDKLFPFFHDYDDLIVHSSITESDLSDEEKEVAFQLRDKVDVLLYTKFGYADRSVATKLGSHGYLNEKGREVKAAGGHFAYIQKQANDKAFQKRKEEVDLKSKEWVYKYRRLPFIFSACALVISIGALIFTALKYFNDTSKLEIQSELNQTQKSKQVLLDTINNKSKEKH